MKLHSPIIITPRLLPGVKIGDKVTLQMTSMIASQYKEHGRVLRRGDDWVEVVKKRSRSKGWSIRVDDETGLWREWI